MFSLQAKLNVYLQNVPLYASNTLFHIQTNVYLHLYNFFFLSYYNPSKLLQKKPQEFQSTSECLVSLEKRTNNWQVKRYLDQVFSQNCY